MGATGIWQNLDIGATTGSIDMGGISIRPGGGNISGRGNKPGPLIDLGLLEEMLRLNGNLTGNFLEHRVFPGEGPRNWIWDRWISPTPFNGSTRVKAGNFFRDLSRPCEAINGFPWEILRRILTVIGSFW